MSRNISKQDFDVVNSLSMFFYDFVMIRPVVEFKLLNLTQVKFQDWVELREINSTQSS